MPTITATPVTHTCTVTLTGRVVTVTAPNGKACSIDLIRARQLGLTLSQLDLLDKARNAAGQTLDLTVTDMKVLVALRDKQGTVSQVQQRTVHATANGVDRRTRMASNRQDEVSNVETELKRLERAAKTLAGDVYMLIYDIPDALSESCPNPSGQLWSVGFRLNKSCWVLPQASLDSSTVRELLSHWSNHPTVECHIIPYADRALKQIREIAAEKIRQRVVEIHTSFIKRLDAASERLEKARAELDQVAKETPDVVSSRDYEKVEASKDSNVRAILKQSATALEAALTCARLFDAEENVADLFEGLRQAINSQVLSFNALMAQKHGKRSNVRV
jgi:seryl-tRNA synthetase